MLLLPILVLPNLPVLMLPAAAAPRRLPGRPDHSAVVGVRAAGRGGPPRPRDGTCRQVSPQPIPLLVALPVLLLLMEVVVAPGAHGGAVEASGLEIEAVGAELIYLLKHYCSCLVSKVVN